MLCKPQDSPPDQHPAKDEVDVLSCCTTSLWLHCARAEELEAINDDFATAAPSACKGFPAKSPQQARARTVRLTSDVRDFSAWKQLIFVTTGLTLVDRSHPCSGEVWLNQPLTVLTMKGQQNAVQQTKTSQVCRYAAASDGPDQSLGNHSWNDKPTRDHACQSRRLRQGSPMSRPYGVQPGGRGNLQWGTIVPLLLTPILAYEIAEPGDAQAALALRFCMSGAVRAANDNMRQWIPQISCTAPPCSR